MKPFAFRDLPKEKFPVEIFTFSPEQELVWASGKIEPYTVVQVPGSGPGSVRYTVAVFGDGTASLLDDPTCNGTVEEGEGVVTDAGPN